ncbi:hypothetical protein HanPI659440_Chr12g0461041 [Helianthus annuus]|nr:hypothetical protein HanPI659440_Chr12g0461041 [Helianthus annuus]
MGVCVCVMRVCVSVNICMALERERKWWDEDGLCVFDGYQMGKFKYDRDEGAAES